MHPHDVLRQHVLAQVRHVRHREEREVGEVETGNPPRLTDLMLQVREVAARRGHGGDARGAAGHARPLDGVMHQGVELQLGPLAGAVATRGGHDRGALRSHAST